MPPTKAILRIDDDNLAMQPAQRLQVANERCRLINMQPHASVGQR